MRECLLEAAVAHPYIRGIRAANSSRNVQDPKSGAGQYFTPRPLIQGIVDLTGQARITSRLATAE